MSAPRFARRVDRIDVSGIRKVFDLASELEDPVNLSIGQPHFDVPGFVKDAAVDAIRDGKNAYTQTQGGPELRAAVHDMLPEGRYAPDEVLITSGVSGGLTLALLALLDEGDEIIMPDPYFVMYKQLAALCNAVPVFVDTYPDFRLDPERVEAAITDRTKLIVFSSPANPTGAVYDDASLAETAKVAERRGIPVVSDEIYRDFAYDGPAPSIADHWDRTLVMGGFSKSHAMTGWRLGWAAGPQDIITAMIKLQQYTYVCAPSFAQIAGAAALGKRLDAEIADYGRKRDRVLAGLREAGYDVASPGGAFYVFPKTPWGTDMEFVEEAIRNNLLIIPGSVFSEKNTHFRISYAAEDETIERGLDILARIAKR